MTDPTILFLILISSFLILARLTLKRQNSTNNQQLINEYTVKYPFISSNPTTIEEAVKEAKRKQDYEYMIEDLMESDPRYYVFRSKGG